MTFWRAVLPLDDVSSIPSLFSPLEQMPWFLRRNDVSSGFAFILLLQYRIEYSILSKIHTTTVWAFFFRFYVLYDFKFVAPILLEEDRRLVGERARRREYYAVARHNRETFLSTRVTSAKKIGNSVDVVLISQYVRIEQGYEQYSPDFDLRLLERGRKWRLFRNWKR